MTDVTNGPATTQPAARTPRPWPRKRTRPGVMYERTTESTGESIWSSGRQGGSCASTQGAAGRQRSALLPRCARFTTGYVAVMPHGTPYLRDNILQVLCAEDHVIPLLRQDHAEDLAVPAPTLARRHWLRLNARMHARKRSGSAGANRAARRRVVIRPHHYTPRGGRAADAERVRSRLSRP